MLLQPHYFFISAVGTSQFVVTIIITGGVGCFRDFGWRTFFVLRIHSSHSWDENLKSLIKQTTCHRTSWTNINPDKWTHSSGGWTTITTTQKGFGRISICSQVWSALEIRFMPHKLLELAVQHIKRQSGLFAPPLKEQAVKCRGQTQAQLNVSFVLLSDCFTRHPPYTSVRLCALHTEVNWLTVTWWAEHKTLTLEVYFTETLNFCTTLLYDDF